MSRTEAARVLVADASPQMRACLAGALGHVSARVSTAADAIEVLYQLAEDGPFHLVVAQEALPVVSGGQLLAMARTAGVLTPFVLVDPLPTRALSALVRRTAPAAILDEPFDSPRLVAIARELIRAHPHPAPAGHVLRDLARKILERTRRSVTARLIRRASMPV